MLSSTLRPVVERAVREGDVFLLQRIGGALIQSRILSGIRVISGHSELMKSGSHFVERNVEPGIHRFGGILVSVSVEKFHSRDFETPITIQTTKTIQWQPLIARAALIIGLLSLVGIVLEFALRRMISAWTTPVRKLEMMVRSGDIISSNLTFSELESIWERHINTVNAREEALREVGRTKVFEAIARTTQSLAHDIRKPFSMFKAIIQSVESTEDPVEVKEILQISLPEVNQAMVSVEGMIQDVMQIGSDSKPLQEEVSPESLLESCLGELFRVYTEAEVQIQYNLKHSHMIFVDTTRVGRVFSNILGNAVQAMNYKGALWIKTRDVDEFVEFTLGNAGSFIPEESLPKLFDAFFTSGKKGGTGLGLAIAKKIVEAHEGSIRCESGKTSEHPNGKVEFVFTLPKTQNLVPTRVETLPKHSSEIHETLAAAKAAARMGGGPDPREAELEREILSQCKDFGQKIPVLFVDDEAVYRNGLVSLLEKNSSIGSLFEILTATNDKQAIAQATSHSPCLIIQDVDLGPESTSGIEIVKALRLKGFKGKICIHSNRFLMHDTKVAIDAGADTVLPKPLSRSHLLKLLIACLPEAKPALKAEGIPECLVETRKPTFAYIDDSISFLIGMRLKVKKEATLHEFKSTKAFFERVEKEPSFLSSLDFLVTDFHFDTSDPHNGLTFASELRSRGFAKPILMASGADFEAEDLERAGVTAALPKVINGWSDLVKWVNYQS